LSASKIGQQKSVICRAKIGRSILDDKNRPIFLAIGQCGDCLQCEMNIYFSYLFCLLLYDVYFHSLDAQKNNASMLHQWQ